MNKLQKVRDNDESTFCQRLTNQLWWPSMGAAGMGKGGGGTCPHLETLKY